MRSKGNAPNANEKRWLEQVAAYGCVVTRRTDVQIHHMYGATARHSKVDIGHWAILPLFWELHDIRCNRPDNITLHKREFEWRHGTEKQLFKHMVERMKVMNLEVPGEEIINAILDYRK